MFRDNILAYELCKSFKFCLKYLSESLNLLPSFLHTNFIQSHLYKALVLQTYF